MSLSIIELLEGVGVDKVKVQFIQACVSGARTRKGGEVEVSFFTDPSNFAPSDLVMPTPRNVGMIVWMPAEDVVRVQASHKARSTAEGRQTP